MEKIDLAYLAAGLAVVVVFTLYMAASLLFARKEKLQLLEKRMGGKNALGAMPELVSLEEEKTPAAEVLAGLLKNLGVDVEKQKEQMGLALIRAGITSADAPVYLAFMNSIGRWCIAGLGALFFLAGLQEEDGLFNFAAGLLFLVVGLMGPQLYLSNQTQRRKRILTRSFPDALDLLVVCVEAGLAIDAALGKVCAEMGRVHPELTQELSRTRLELALLNDRSQAFQNLAERVDLAPVRSLVAALIQTEKFGTSLVDTLRVLSDDYRQTRMNVAENKAGRLPALMTIPMVVFLLPVLFIILMGPAVIKLQEQGGLFGNALNKPTYERQHLDNIRRSAQ